MAEWRIDLEGRTDDEPERIAIVFLDEDGNESYRASFEPEYALELAASLADTYGLHRRWLDARDHHPDASMPESRAMTGLTVESYRLHVLLESGYALEDAERLATDGTVDLHEAERLAKDAGPALAAEILT